MAKGKFENVDPQVLDAYMRMIAGVDGVEARGAAAPYTSLNGNMYSSISKFNEIGLRLGKADREEFLEKYDTRLYHSIPGYVQREYVTIPQSMLGNTRTLRSWFRRSFEYVSSLKPKPTTKKK